MARLPASCACAPTSHILQVRTATHRREILQAPDVVRAVCHLFGAAGLLGRPAALQVFACDAQVSVGGLVRCGDWCGRGGWRLYNSAVGGWKVQTTFSSVQLERVNQAGQQRRWEEAGVCGADRRPPPKQGGLEGARPPLINSHPCYSEEKLAGQNGGPEARAGGNLPSKNKASAAASLLGHGGCFGARGGECRAREQQAGQERQESPHRERHECSRKADGAVKSIGRRYRVSVDGYRSDRRSAWAVRGPAAGHAGGAVGPHAEEAAQPGPRHSGFRFALLETTNRLPLAARESTGLRPARAPTAGAPAPLRSAGCLRRRVHVLHRGRKLKPRKMYKSHLNHPLEQRHGGLAASAACLLGRRQHSVQHRAVHQQRLGTALHGHSHQLVQQLHGRRAGGGPRHQARGLRRVGGGGGGPRYPNPN